MDRVLQDRQSFLITIAAALVRMAERPRPPVAVMRFQSLLLAVLVCLCASACSDSNPVVDLASYRAFRTPGMSMEPAIVAGDIVYVDMD